MKSEIENELSFKKLANDEFQGIKITEDNLSDIVDFYEEHKNEYTLVYLCESIASPIIYDIEILSQKITSHIQYFLIPKNFYYKEDRIYWYKLYEKDEYDFAHDDPLTLEILLELF